MNIKVPKLRKLGEPNLEPSMNKLQYMDLYVGYAMCLIV